MAANRGQGQKPKTTAEQKELKESKTAAKPQHKIELEAHEQLKVMPLDVIVTMADSGEKNAIYTLAVLSESGEGIPQDFVQAYRGHTSAANQNHSHAQVHLALCYAHGRGVPQDLDLAIHWLTLSATQKNPFSGTRAAICERGSRSF